MDIKHANLEDKELDTILNAMMVPEFDSATMEKRIMAAIERGAIAAKFKPQSNQRAVHRSFWKTLGRETVGMAMMASIVLAVLIQIPGRITRLSTMEDGGQAPVMIDAYVAAVDEITRYETREEAILDSVLAMADNTGTRQKTDEDDIDALLDDLADEQGEPDDYWNYLLGDEMNAG